jgi:hypothetical protein
LAHDGEQVCLVEPTGLLIEATRRAKERELETAAGVLNAVAEHVERTAPLDLGGETFKELLAHRSAVVLLELLPQLGLRREDEIDYVARDKAKSAVVVLGRSLSIAAGERVTIRRAGNNGISCAGVRPSMEKRTLDRFLEACARRSQGSRGLLSHVKFAGHRGRNEGGAELVEAVDGVAALGGKGINPCRLAVEEGSDGALLDLRGHNEREVANFFLVEDWQGRVGSDATKHRLESLELVGAELSENVPKIECYARDLLIGGACLFHVCHFPDRRSDCYDCR